MKNVRVLTITIFVHFIALSVLLPLLPSIANQFGISSLQATLIEASFPTAHLLALPLMGYLAEKFGIRRLIPASLLLQCLGFAILALAPTLAVLVTSRVIGGMASAILPLSLAYTHTHLVREDRVRGFALIMIGVTAGIGLGPLLGGWFGLAHLSELAMFAAILSFTASILAANLPEHRISRQGGFFVYIRRSRTLLLIAFSMLFVGTSFQMTQVLLPFSVESSIKAGVILGVIGLGTMCVQLILSMSKKSVPHELSYSFAVTLMTAAILGFALAGPLGLMAGVLLMSIGTGLADPFASAIVTKNAPAHATYSVTTGVFAIAAIAKIVGPPTAGALLLRSSVSQSLAFAIVPAMIGVILSLMLKQKTVQQDRIKPKANYQTVSMVPAPKPSQCNHHAPPTQPQV